MKGNILDLITDYITITRPKDFNGTHVIECGEEVADLIVYTMNYVSGEDEYITRSEGFNPEEVNYMIVYYNGVRLKFVSNSDNDDFSINISREEYTNE